MSMYHEQKLVDGVWCYRNHPDAKWTRYTLEELSLMYEDLDRRLNVVLAALYRECDGHD